MRFKKPEKTKEPDNGQKAYEYAVFLLTLKLRTIGEIRVKMEKRGYSSPTVEKTIERLHDQRYLDDGRYAEIFLENLIAYRNFGFYGIKKKFLEKKLPPDLINRLLADRLSIAEETKIAIRLLRKEGFAAKDKSTDHEIEYRAFGDNEQNKETAKMANRLKSRGFRGEVIARVLF